MSSSIDIGKFEEDDDVERTAHFYIYASKLQSLAAPSGSLGVATGLFDLKTLMHWSVVVTFESLETIYTFDADTSGSLTGGEFVVKVKRELPKLVQRKIKVGTVRISPKELIRRAKQVKLNEGKYDFIFANCQSWAQQFCSEISPDFVNSLPVSIGECTTWAAVAGQTVLSIGLVAFGIVKSLRYYQDRKSTLEEERAREEKEKKSSI